MNDNIIKYNEENNHLESENSNFTLSLNINEFINEKERKNFVKTIKNMLTRFPEYKRWREYIIDTLGFNRCFFTNESIDELTLDVHHHPICREAIINAVIDKKLENDEGFNSLTILTEVMNLHFINKVGFVVLIKSLHEKFHNGYLAIPMNYVQGNWEYLIENYNIAQEYMNNITEYTNYYDADYQYTWVNNTNVFNNDHNSNCKNII
jgi:hypothetical protein